MTLDAERELITRCQRGDSEAWDAFFDEHYGPAARFIYQLAPILTREDADEICQETFLAAINHLGGFQFGSRVQTWIFKIARNKTRDFLEKQSAAKRGGGETTISLQAENDEGGLLIDPPATTPTPDRRLVEMEDCASIASALEQLGEPCREIIDLRYFADLSYEEISTSLELNVKTVSSRLSKCLDRLEEVWRKMDTGRGEVFPSNLKEHRDGGGS